MLKEAFESAAPYISNFKEIRRFVEENEGKNLDEVIKLIEKRIDESDTTLSTDYRILLNELRKMINTGL